MIYVNTESKLSSEMIEETKWTISDNHNIFSFTQIWLIIRWGHVTERDIIYYFLHQEIRGSVRIDPDPVNTIFSSLSVNESYIDASVIFYRDSRNHEAKGDVLLLVRFLKIASPDVKRICSDSASPFFKKRFCSPRNLTNCAGDNRTY